MNLKYTLCLALFALAQSAAAQSGSEFFAAHIRAHETAAPAALLDRARFVAAPAITQVKLAPDGRHVAWLARETSGLRLHLMDVRTQSVVALFNSTALTAIHWARDSETLILDLGSAVGALALARPAAPAYLATLDPRQQDYLITPGEGRDAFVLIVRRPATGGFVLERVSLSGGTEQLLASPERIKDAIASADGESVFVLTATEAEQPITQISAAQQTELFTCELLERCDLVAWDEAAATLWINGNRSSDLKNLLAWSITNRQMQTVHTDPAALVDLSGVTLMNGLPAVLQYHEGTQQNFGVGLTLTAPLERIAAQFPASNITPALSDDAKVWLLKEDSATLQFSRYHLYDDDTGVFTEILQPQQPEALPEAELSRKIPLQYRGSDGLLLHGYVSLPSGVPLSQTPLVAFIHGGPMGRITSGYDTFTQFLVNRGNIVFEPNFRASTGYGRHYTESAAGEFGNGRVQQDIVDGVQFLLAQGIGNPDAMAIAGHSFGGSAVLAGLAFTPELFKAGFASAPPAAMGLTLRHQLTDERRIDIEPAQLALFTLLFGDVDDPAAMQALDSKAPLSALAAIEAPLLLVAGGDDAQVPISHVKDYSLALLGLNKQLALLIDEDQGHGVGQAGAATQFEYLFLAETFLGAYLGGQAQPADAQLEAQIARKLVIDTLPGVLPTID